MRGWGGRGGVRGEFLKPGTIGIPIWCRADTARGKAAEPMPAWRTFSSVWQGPGVAGKRAEFVRIPFADSQQSLYQIQLQTGSTSSAYTVNRLPV